MRRCPGAGIEQESFQTQVDQLRHLLKEEKVAKIQVEPQRRGSRVRRQGDTVT